MECSFVRCVKTYLECLALACSHSQVVGVSRSLLPASLCRAPDRWARLATHRRKGPHQACSPCSRAHFSRLTTACVSSPKGLGCLHWLTQQDMVISKAPPHLSAPLPPSFCVHLRKPRYKKLAMVSLRHGCQLALLFSAPPGASCTVVIKHDKWNTSVQRTKVLSKSLKSPLVLPKSYHEGQSGS